MSSIRVLKFERGKLGVMRHYQYRDLRALIVVMMWGNPAGSADIIHLTELKGAVRERKRELAAVPVPALPVTQKRSRSKKPAKPMTRAARETRTTCDLDYPPAAA